MTTSSISSASNTGSIPVTTPISVTSSSSAGAAGGSVINVSSLVSELVAAAQAPQESLIASQTSAVTANISALGTLQGALSTFQSSLSSLSTPSAFNSQTASSSDQTVLTATADADAVSGSYNVTVTNLASGQQLLSKAFSGGGTATVGTGTLSISLGGSSFAVTINGNDDTLAGIASAIDSAANNPGVSATIVTGTDGAHLVMSSTLTGAANTLAVTETDGGTGLSALTYGTGNTGNYTQQTAAADAHFSIAGVGYTSASNTVSDALTGVTLNLLGTTASGSSATLTVANDTSTVQSNIANFVSAYNTLQSALSSLGSYDASSNTAGAMQGNPILTNTQSQIQQTLYSLVGSSAYNTLASIGITTNSDGSLSLNNATLATALSSNFSAVSQLFSSSSGVAAQLNSQITADLASGGTLAAYSQSLTSQNNALTTRSNTLSAQMTALTASLTQQYATLNTLLSSLQSTSSYLTQAFASLPTVQGKPNA
ncbi:MAG TPA: flagellar filament capping protein FliD [Steroidobacteraceae bacterium]|nr:flagellar filament capping protein FliD [Steroidobacteraceae bacterium]